MADRPGTLLGRYRLGPPIGTGGFATVYRATDERLDCEVAVKVLAENHALDPDMRERFVGEAQLLRRAASDAIVAVHDIGETDRGQPYIVLEYADRGDLRRRIAERQSAGTVTAADVAVVADMLRRALGAIHAAGVVHRDVKPENILIVSSGGRSREGGLLGGGERLLLGDLGYAKDLAASSGLTVGGGTVGFRAPEQDRTGLVDHRADVYAASAVLHWMATGTVPGPDATGVTDLSGLSEQIWAAIRRGLDKNPGGRFSSIDEWHEAMGLDADPTERGSSESPPRASRRWVRASVTAAVVVVIGSGLWVASSARTTRLDLADGVVRLERETDGVTLLIEGPSVVEKGDVVVFEGRADGAADVRWVGPNGGIHDAAGPLEVVAVEEGEGTVSLVGTTAGGEPVGLSFRFEVTG